MINLTEMVIENRPHIPQDKAEWQPEQGDEPKFQKDREIMD
jgi:hypothetical protein